MQIELTGILEIANPVEAQASWEDVGQNPSSLYSAMARVFKVTISGLDQTIELFVGSSTPEGVYAGKVWFDTGSVPRIGIPSGTEYNFIYPYPPNVPFLWVKGADTKPSYLRPLTPTELEDFELTNPENDLYFYVILEV